jgi:hypothetical protein
VYRDFLSRFLRASEPDDSEEEGKNISLRGKHSKEVEY